MGNSCSCFHVRRDVFSLNDPTKREASWFPIVQGEDHPEAEEDEPSEIVKVESGRLMKTEMILPHGAAANLASLICQAYDLAQMAIHSKTCSVFLVKKLISIQEAIVGDRLLLADGVLMLQAQELALEVGQLIKLFSCRGWLARLNGKDVDDELEAGRLCQRLNVLREKCGLNNSEESREVDDHAPVSAKLMRTIKRHASLQTHINKPEAEIVPFIQDLLPSLSTEHAFAAQAIKQEIRIAAASELPAAHTVIRHFDLRYFWWAHFESEEASWKDFWKFFPAELGREDQLSDGIGDLDAVIGLMQSHAARRQFKTAINTSRNSEYILSIELDNAFAPNRTLEESVAILLSPLDGSPGNLQHREQFLRQPVIQALHKTIRDEAGVLAEGAEVIGRVGEVGRISGLIEMGRRVVMVTGPPGIGKTTVTATVADELLNGHILQTVHYLNLTNVADFSDAVFRLGAALKHPIYQSSLSSEERLKNWIKRHGNKDVPVGWALDGLDHLFLNDEARSSLFNLLSEVLGFHPKLHIILTCSRAPPISEVPFVDEVFEIGPLQEQDGFRFAESLLGRALSRGEARSLVAATQGFPLGIKIGGSGILAGGCSAAHLDQRLDLISADANVDMRAPWNRAHDMIREGINALPSEDRHGLILLCQCPDNFTVEHASAVLGQLQKPTQTWSLLWRLNIRGFVRQIPTDGSYRLEEAVQDVLSHCTAVQSHIYDTSSFGSVSQNLEISEQQRDEARAGLVIYYLRLLDRALEVYRLGFRLSTYRLLEQERDGLERFVQYIGDAAVRKKLITHRSRARLPMLLKILNDFVVDVGRHYFTWSQVRSICTSVGWLWEEDFKTEYDEIAYKLRLSLANALACIGERRDAEIILNQVEAYIDGLPRCTEVDLKSKADILVLRAKIQHLIGRYPEAERFFLQGLHAQQGAYGANHFTVSRTYSLLATVQQILSKVSDADQSYKASLKIRMKHQRKNCVEVPTVMHNWASLTHKRGRHQYAEKLYVQSLALREKYLGHRNIEVASSLTSLAAVKVALNEYETARTLYTRALTMLKDIMGEEHLVVGYTATRLGVLLEIQKNYDEAIQRFHEALSIDERVYGASHDQVLRSIGRIQRAALKHAQTLRTSKQLSTWRTYIEELLRKYDFKWPEQSSAENRPAFAVETSADLMATSISISQTANPDASQSDPKTESTTSFQGFATRLGGASTSGSDFDTPLNSSSLRFTMESIPKANLPPGLQRNPSMYAADPPTLEGPGWQGQSRAEGSRDTGSLMASTQLTELSQYSTPPEMTRTVSHAYPQVHDNSEFGLSTSTALETDQFGQTSQDMRFANSSSPCTTFTLEDDLSEMTTLIPEQYDAVQSMIRNPLYRYEDRSAVLPPCETPEPLINTHASFEL